MLTKRKNIQNELILATTDELVPLNHDVRKLNLIDYSFIYDQVDDYYAKDGRPSVDPVILFKILLLKYLYHYPTLTQTLKEIEVNIAYRWFLKIPLHEKLPPLSVLSDNLNHRLKDQVDHIFQTLMQNLSLQLNMSLPKTQSKDEALYESTLV